MHAFVDRFGLLWRHDFGPDFFLAHLLIGVFNVLVRGGMRPVGDVIDRIGLHLEGARDQLRWHAFDVEGIDSDSFQGREFALSAGVF